MKKLNKTKEGKDITRLPFSKIAEKMAKSGKPIKKLDLHKILDEQYEQKFRKFITKQHLKTQNTINE